MGIGRELNLDAVDEAVNDWARERPELDVSSMEVFGRMHRCYLQYQALLSSLLGSYGLNVAAFDVLAALRRSGAPYQMTAGQLAETALLTSGGITLRVDKLEQAGLVKRERDSDDRRVVYVHLTDEGLQLVNRVADDHFENGNALLAGLSVAKRKDLAKLLRALESSIVDGGSVDQEETA
ncbi:MarR family winged helix-turn-helix transcriptional regulator [Nocardia australiensis]|uniref:MarR family winged helix-turn-helix transcriptional regulator n=1 Tax=Nocardia australiensis TaxID=2887191 RepID=UPI001D13EC6A|nr:MarR family transcriptional regulator [Nocardia australiensis]